MPERLAIDGGTPVRSSVLPYGRQQIDDEDVAAVVAALRSAWLTTGPAVEEFERKFSEYVGASHAVAVSSGTAALHAAMDAVDLKAGDEVIVTPMTFAASANCIVYCGGTPVFADVEPGTLLLDPAQVEAKITPRTRAVVAVDYTGQPAALDELLQICRKHDLVLIEDACHALGAEYHGRKVGSIADMTVFSFHPVKHITTGEGGMITTNRDDLAGSMKRFRNHGITSDFKQRAQTGSYYYEMVELGYNYRLTDLQCALGVTQLHKLPGWLERRRAFAAQYNEAFGGMNGVTPLKVRQNVLHAYHLYVAKFEASDKTHDRDWIFKALRAEGIGVNVHYIPVHLHPYYRKTWGTGEGLCPVAEAAYSKIISLPMFNGMSDGDLADVIASVEKLHL
jgi:perosamine synthetase